ncbi:hypothetical protein LO762_28105 [Actinocorallia sp. API 0066]|uniref:hypothetical protein n=1 Tax=Actinocorallia sp. API 0066 TaxID=2896846 RepID=UPI001E4059EF|nr:hypothetical protein [Actinocorallia sp. API 0066]MCD0453016.1 hypothetical protein [Actinocorallia sp. API 0066]
MSITPLRLVTAAVPAAALTVGLVLAVGAPASAAPKPCAVGTWQLTKYTLKSHINEVTANAKGGTGTRLTITKKSATYDFSKAAKVVTKGVAEGDPYKVTDVFKKKVTFKSTLIGKKKTGSLTLRPKTGTGNATISSFLGKQPTGTAKLAKIYRTGIEDPFLPTFGQYTCTSKTLRLVLEADGPRTTIKSVHTFKRV